MPRYYGTLHSLSEFIGKLIPRSRKAIDGTFFHAVVNGLQRLDVAQRENQWLTFTVSAGGGVWVTYKGLRYFMILPGQKSLRIITDPPGGNIAKTLDRAAKKNLVIDSTNLNEYRQWNIPLEGLETVWSFLEQLDAPSPQEILARKKHTRIFPGPVRQAALEQFERGGRYCPGVAVPGKEQRRHKVDDTVRIEFDHVLPHARGGSNGVLNIQVLCETCNRVKSANAY